MDSGRKMRQLEKKLQRYEHEGTAKSKTLGLVKAKLNELKKEPVPVGSVSGSLARYIAKWVSQIPADFLEFYALNLPKVRKIRLGWKLIVLGPMERTYQYLPLES